MHCPITLQSLIVHGGITRVVAYQTISASSKIQHHNRLCTLYHLCTMLNTLRTCVSETWGIQSQVEQNINSASINIHMSRMNKESNLAEADRGINGVALPAGGKQLLQLRHRSMCRTLPSIEPPRNARWPASTRGKQVMPSMGNAKKCLHVCLAQALSSFKCRRNC